MAVRDIDFQDKSNTKRAAGVDHRVVQARAMEKLWHPSQVFEPFPVEDLELSIPERFAKTVAAYPDRHAIEFDSQTMTFAEFNNAANVVARYLLDELGTEPKPVSMLFDQSAAMLTVIMGILKAGKFYVPLNPHDPPQRWQQILADVEPSILLVDPSNYNRANELPNIGAKVFLFTEFDLDRSEPDPDIKISPEAYAYVLYTSGSTGAPKGVIGPHRNVLRYAKNVINHVRLCPHDRSAMVQSVSFSGSQNAIFPPLFTGAVSCVFDVHKEGLRALAKWLAIEEITFLHGSMVFLAMTEFMDDACSLPSMRIVYGGAGPTYRRHVETFKRVFTDNCIYVSSYGSTEMLGIGRLLVDTEYELEGEILPIGFQDDEIEVLIWGEDGHPVGEGEAGEIVVRTKFLSPGYWRRPDLTARIFPEDPDNPGQKLYRTGDVGRFLEDGCLVHLGRLDYQVKVRGNRVEIGEVESHLLNEEDIRECVVHTISNDLGVELVAYVVGNGTPPDIQQLRRSLGAVSPDYAVPQRFIVLEALPRLLTGKVDYKSLPAPGRERPELTTPYAAPTKKLEERLARVWAEVLDLDSVGIDDRFTDLGGDSLSAVRLLSALEELTGRKLPFAVIAEASTVRELAERLDTEYLESQWQTLVRIQEGGDRPPLFLVPPAGSTSIGFAQLAQYLGDNQPVYSFDPVGMNGEADPQDSVEEMASLYMKELQQIQPHGPYYLGGRCFGARPAVEMAHQLEQQGEKVNMVAIIDGGLYQEPKEISLLVKWQRRRKISPIHEIIAKSLRFRTLKLYQSLLESTGFVRSDGDDEKMMDPVFRAHMTARRRYRPRTIQARMVVIVSEEFADAGYHLGWRQLSDGEYVEHHSAHWTHHSFLKDPVNLEEVSTILRNEIDQATT